MVMIKMITIFRHSNLVLHVRMKGALLGSVDLALQVLISINIILSRFAVGKIPLYLLPPCWHFGRNLLGNYDHAHDHIIVIIIIIIIITITIIIIIIMITIIINMK